MIKYRTMWDKIEAMEIVRETPKMVVLATTSAVQPERKEHKRSDWINWHDTWKDAHKFLVDQQQEKINKLRRQLERENGKLGQLKGMKQAV